MTAEQIRDIELQDSFSGYSNAGLKQTNEFLREIAAQLAEFNERCAQNCTKIEEKK